MRAAITTHEKLQQQVRKNRIEHGGVQADAGVGIGNNSGGYDSSVGDVSGSTVLRRTGMKSTRCAVCGRSCMYHEGIIYIYI